MAAVGLPPGAKMSPLHADVLYVFAKVKEQDCLEAYLKENKVSHVREIVKSFDVISFVMDGITCAAVCGDLQGPESAGILTMGALKALRPRAAVMVGICAGNRKALYEAVGVTAKTPEMLLKKADAVAAKGVFVVCSSRAVNIGDGTITKDGNLVRTIKVPEIGVDACKSLTWAVLGAGGQRDNYVQEAAYMLTSPHLHDSFDFSAFSERKLYGLDMEASAFIRACNQVHDQPEYRSEANCLGIFKGVSDFADELSRDGKQRGRVKECVVKAFKIAHAAVRRYFKASGDAIVKQTARRFFYAANDKEAATLEVDRLKKMLLASAGDSQLNVVIELHPRSDADKAVVSYQSKARIEDPKWDNVLDKLLATKELDGLDAHSLKQLKKAVSAAKASADKEALDKPKTVNVACRKRKRE